MKKFILQNAKIITAFVIGLVISGAVVYAATLVNANQVAYSSGTVEEALNDLYSKATQIKAIKKFCQLKSETALTVGSKYECDPGDGLKRNFCVLTIRNNEVDLIMENNISDTVGTAKTMSWNDAMKYFRTGAGKDIPGAWTNVMNIDLPKAQAITDATGYNWVAANNSTWWCFGSKAQDVQGEPYCNNSNQGTYAWLFNHLMNCKTTGCTDDSGATASGYWTRDLVSNTTYAWRVIRIGNLGRTTVSNSTDLGVRPVITVLKSNLYK